MDKNVYSWKNSSGWCAICWSASGAEAFSFGNKTKQGAVEKALGYTRAGSEDDVRSISDTGLGPKWLTRAVRDIDSFFAGKPVQFNIPLSPRRATSFQQAVWDATVSIPHGETRSYAWVAQKAGSPGATRAAGSALGANPLPIIIPCHRVVKSDGTLGGFGLGPEAKAKLLAIETRGPSSKRN